MNYERDLQVRLRERYKRLFKSSEGVYDRECGYFRQFVMSSPALKAIVDAIEQIESDLDPEQWVAENFQNRSYDWPPTETGRAKVAWWLLGQWTDSQNIVRYLRCFSYETNVRAALRDMTEAALEPLVEYFEERLGTESEMLYLLERFQRRLEAFDQNELYEQYLRQTTKGESVYDLYLRRFLFDQGVDYPFSQPSSASGKADVVGDIHTDDPLVCEVKLYDGGQYGVPYIAKGLNQALSYARDYGKTVAHLVTINLSEHSLQLPSDADVKSWPPRLHVSGVTVYLVVAGGKPVASASRRGRLTPRVISREELVRPLG
jgi:hypothetical protein